MNPRPERSAAVAARRAKPARQAAILELVRTRAIRTQDELVDALQAFHLDATQATVSRDIRELGLQRLADSNGARYVVTRPATEEPPGIGSRLRTVMRDHVRSVEFVEVTGVLRSRPSTAPLVAAAIDAARLEDVAGTVAGDDTVLVVARGRTAATRLQRRLRELIGEAG